MCVLTKLKVLHPIMHQCQWCHLQNSVYLSIPSQYSCSYTLYISVYLLSIFLWIKSFCSVHRLVFTRPLLVFLLGQPALPHSYSFLSADHSFMCVPASLLACACLCDAISHMAPERLSACVETLAQLAGLDKVSTRLCQFMCVVVEWVWSPRTSFRHTDIHVHSHKGFCNFLSDSGTHHFKVWA